MNIPKQQIQIRTSWLNDLGPAMLMTVGLAMLGAAVPSAFASPPTFSPSTEHYTIKTVDAPGSAGAGCTWINDVGMIVQQYIDAGNNLHAAVFSCGKWTTIDVPGAADTAATNANNLGQVALTYNGTDGIYHLAIWQNGHYTYIPDPCPGYVFESANGMNDLGQVTSYGNDDSNGNQVAIVASYGEDGRVKDIHVFTYPGSPITIPLMTNDLGITVGSYFDAEYVLHAFVHYLYDKTYFSFDIPGGVNPLAFSINNEGNIVGFYQLASSSGDYAGFVLEDGRLTAFDVPGALQSCCQGVNDNLQLAGTYQLADGIWHGFVATPISCK